MTNRVITGLLCLMVAGSAFSATFAPWGDGNWSLYMINNANNATLNVNTSGKKLRVNGALGVGHATATGFGTLNVTAGTIELGASSSIYDLLDVNGGTMTIDKSAADVTISGDGLLKVQSGTLNNIGSAPANVSILQHDVEISGGTVNLTGQNYLTGTTTIKGDGATINIDRINSSAANTGNYVFELGASGISAINNGSWMTLGDVSISVEGSAYTGGTGTFTLFDTVNLSSTSTVTSVTGFTGGLSGIITQDQGSDIVTLTIGQAPVDNNTLVLALGNLTNAPTLFADDTTMTTTNVNAGELNAIYFDALDYNGSNTRVYAYIGLPAGASSNSPVPGVVLVHGGGGTAFDEWVELWTNQGYAAISIAVEGQTDSTAPPVMNTGWHIHNMPGPVRDGIYGDTDEPLTNQWMYHAVADTILANSLLRSLPEVVSTNVGVMGISWGGVITSTAIGIDDRFRFAVPTYGCGSLATADNIYGTVLGDNDLYKDVWDPMVRITNATMPTLWFSWPEDSHFPMESLADCYTNAPGERMVSLVPGMGHGHGSAWNRPESYAYADSIISNGTGWCVQQSVNLSNDVAEVVFQSSKTLDSAKLVSTVNGGFTGDRTWTEATATLVDNGGGNYTITATLPEYTTAWFINGLSGTLVASSDYQETDAPPPSNIVYDITANWSSKTVNGNDDVTITNGAIISLDVDDAAASLAIADGTLQMDQNYTLSLSGPLRVDANGTVNLNDGAVASDATTLSLDGTMAINGGTFSRVTTGTGYTVSGGGTLQVQSGLLAFTGGAPTDVTKLNTDMEISGGSVDLDGQIYVGNGVATEFKVVGDDATINIERLNGAGSTMGSFTFELDETGVSPVNVSAWMSMVNIAVAVDGSAYTNGAATMPLLDSTNLSALGDTNNFSVSGFTAQGLDASIVQQQAPGHWVQLVLTEHVPVTVTYTSSANWSAETVQPNDNVVVESGATVSVDVEAAADSLQLDGTLLLPLDITGFSPMTLQGSLTVGASGGIEVDGTLYEGFDGYFPLILSTNLTAGLTNNVMFTGFGDREPAVVVQPDGLWLRLIARPSLSERLTSLVPDSTVAVDYSNSTFSATRALQPTVSAWTPTFNEAHVQDTTLAQTVGGSSTLSWEMRTARGGNVYSLRIPAIGETVPPSWRSDTNSSPWNDEVWQGVAVSPTNDPPDNPYFMHQSGVYLQDPIQTEPFYSPQVAAYLDEADRSFTTVNWTPQAHTKIYADGGTTNDFKSYMLMYTRYRDLGQGVIEASLGMYNYGPDTLNFLNMPWGGVRRTSTEYAFIAETNGTSWSAPRTENWGQTTNFNLTGGWMGYSDTTSGVTPALGFVFGQDHETPLPEQNQDHSTFRWGYAGGAPTGNEADWRNYFVTSVIRWYDLTRGNGVWSRYYFVLGDDMQDLSDRINARGLVDTELAAFDYSETNSPLVGYSFTGSGTSFRVQEDAASPDFFLYAHPVQKSLPIFEVIRNDESRYLTWNPYVNGIVKPYDGTLAGLHLLGFAMREGDINFGQSVYPYSSLSGVIPSANYEADGQVLSVRTITDIERWRVEYFGFADDAGDGANTANPDSDPVNNLYEYGLGGDPTNGADIGTEPVLERGANWLDYVHVRRAAATNEISYSLETSTNLVSGTWSNMGYSIEGYGPLAGDFDTVTNRIDTSVEDQQFIKLIIEEL